MKTVHTPKAPAALGPYSQGIKANGFLFTAGCIALIPETMEIDGTDITTQTERTIRNLGEILKEGGSSFEKVVKTTCFLADMDDFAAFNEVYAKYFTGKPARSCVAVKTLPKNVLCEIEAVAVTEE